MSVTQAMEWLIEHIDEPTADSPLPGQDTLGAAAAAMAAPLPSTPAPPQCGTGDSKQDELTEVFKRIRRKREFRPDARVSCPEGALFLRSPAALGDSSASAYGRADHCAPL